MRVRAAGLGLLVGSLGLGFGLNTVEPYPCYRYACMDEQTQKTFRWQGQVEVWVAKDAPQEVEENLRLAVKMWETISGIDFVWKGRGTLTSEEAYDAQRCVVSFTLLNSDYKGIYLYVIPDSCIPTFIEIYGDLGEAGEALVPVVDTINAGDPMLIPIGVVNTYRKDLHVYLHEVGHAMGLNHPIAFGESQDINNNPTYSIMQSDVFVSVPASPDDVEVAQYLYGSPAGNEPMEVFEYSTETTSIASSTPQGICVAGGNYPFQAFVVAGNCQTKRLADMSGLCWEVSGEAGSECTIRVVDSQGNSVDYTLLLQQVYLTDTPTTVVEETDGGAGGGGGCNTGAEAGLGTLVALVLYGLRRLLSRPLS